MLSEECEECEGRIGKGGLRRIDVRCGKADGRRGEAAGAKTEDGERRVTDQSRRLGASANAATVLVKHSEQRRGGEEVGGAWRLTVTTMDNDFLGGAVGS